jgi:hypothetical protein
MNALPFFYNQHEKHFKQLNIAHIILIPKKMDVESVGDYRPISLTHCMAKLFSKVLANRLAGYLGSLVSRA